MEPITVLLLSGFFVGLTCGYGLGVLSQMFVHGTWDGWVYYRFDTTGPWLDWTVTNAATGDEGITLTSSPPAEGAEG